MELNKVYCSDCREFLKTIPDNFVDSVVTDPPAGISFMGKSWDKDKGGRKEWISWLSDIFVEVKRVLKPGGHCLVWALPRTSHWTGTALEDAGFEVRDCVYHVFGCLSEDTEILTINGWEHYHKNICLYPVLCYLCEENRFEFHKPTKEYCYENKYPVYRIQSDHTDQIVSRNHRVLVERSGRKEFVFAETLEQQENIPFLESLSDLPETIPNIYKGTSITKQDLLKRVQRKENIKIKKRGVVGKNFHLDKRTLCALWKNSRNEKGTTQIQQENILQSFLSGETCNCTNINTKQIRQNRNEISWNWFKRKQKSCMERWGNIFQNTWQLCWGKICQMSHRVFIYGKKGWLCYGTPSNYGNGITTSFTSDGNSTSYKSQPNEQRSFKSNVIQNESGTQTVRRTTATITEIEYKGNVWCVEVPTGAFIARRNGKIFITGNSGFPKSLNVGKAVSKLTGEEREVIGTQKHPTSKDRTGNKSPYQAEQHLNSKYDLTKGTSEFEGQGTALKPAVECWWLVRKPLSEKTIAENVLKWGTGGLNIEMCRIPLQETGEDSRLGGKGTWSTENAGWVVSGSKRKRVSSSEKGRFPANFIHDGSEEVLSCFPNAGGQQGDLINHSHKTISPNGIYETLPARNDTYKRNEEETSAARFFYCAKSSRSERNFGCEDLEKKTSGMVSNTSGQHITRRDGGAPEPKGNNHPTVKSITLMRYLCRLITPPKGIVLDLFAGSGTTFIAAEIEGFGFIGCDDEENSCKIAEARIKAWRFKSKVNSKFKNIHRSKPPSPESDYPSFF